MIVQVPTPSQLVCAGTEPADASPLSGTVRGWGSCVGDCSIASDLSDIFVMLSLPLTSKDSR